MKRYAFFLITAMALTACGGGGGWGSGSGNNTALLPPSSSAGAPAPQVAVVPKFTVVDLGVNVYPAAVNSSGTVVGYILHPSVPGNAYSHAFSYFNGLLHDLGTMPGDTSSAASDVNDNGTIVGQSSNATNANIASVIHAALFTGASVTDLGGLPGNALNYATAVNDAGTIVGHSDPQSGGVIAPCTGTAVTFDGHGGAQTISALGSGLPAAINDSGDIVGKACSAGTVSQTLAFSYPPYTTLTGPHGSSNECPGARDEEYAADVNKLGHITGIYYANVSAPQCIAHAFLLVNGAYTDISGPGPNGATTGALVHGMNDSDWVVGETYFNEDHALLYVQGTSYDLNSLLTGTGCILWTLTSAVDINNSDVIVGTGQLNGQEHGFMLLPKH